MKVIYDAETYNKVKRYNESNKKVKEINEHFNSMKVRMNKLLFNRFGEDENILCIKANKNDGFEKGIKIIRVDKIIVEFNIQKMKKQVNKKVLKKVINKQYVVNDILGLVNYLKEIGADSEIVKSFINTVEDVDKKMLDKCYELGEITGEEIKDVYVVNKKFSHYLIKQNEE